MIIRTLARSGLFLASLLLYAVPATAETPKWIWHDNKGAAIQTNEVRFFRKTFQVESRPTKATLSVAADDEAVVYLNGKEVARPKDYSKPGREDVTDLIKKGQNVLAIRGQNNAADEAGVVAVLELKSRKGSDFIVSDETWLSSAKEEAGWQNIDFAASKWTKAVSRGKLGDKPWGDVLKVAKATPAESLTVLPGFKDELLHASVLWQ